MCIKARKFISKELKELSYSEHEEMFTVIGWKSFRIKELDGCYSCKYGLEFWGQNSFKEERNITFPILGL